MVVMIPSSDTSLFPLTMSSFADFRRVLKSDENGADPPPYWDKHRGFFSPLKTNIYQLSSLFSLVIALCLLVPQSPQLAAGSSGCGVDQVDAIALAFIGMATRVHFSVLTIDILATFKRILPQYKLHPVFLHPVFLIIMDTCLLFCLLGWGINVALSRSCSSNRLSHKYSAFMILSGLLQIILLCFHCMEGYVWRQPKVAKPIEIPLRVVESYYGGHGNDPFVDCEDMECRYMSQKH
ncbi:hypothetical protein EJ08DRAFT_683407 [Tothia fuscella]|uniref:Uncharacterized protein n=1 Tax=Tothia fuscella TaxID=1048955 RepID=A0A9P4TTP7_9PEZI|nr:hypothetical protein EJ08DRAFT_683407 [Tothia fuscella]